MTAFFDGEDTQQPSNQNGVESEEYENTEESQFRDKLNLRGCSDKIVYL